jgi:2-desacetyl-2-hydroxyethyl bacteriochlorophyllide A dehydrogenase
MESILYEALGELSIQQIERPTLQASEVLVQTKASGVCHTDIDVLYGRYGNSTFPLVPGHEYAGVITEVGSDVNNLSVGDRVVVDPNFSCGHCQACEKGLSNLCETLGAYGVTRHGGFAEFSAVAAENVIPIGDMDFSLAALAEPMGCVLNGVGAIGTEGVKTAMIFGAGPIGLLMAIALKTKGIDDIALVDLDPSRLERIESIGFTPIAGGSNELEKRRQRVDLVVDATGVAAVAESLINYAANGGKVLFFGVCSPDVKISISPFEVFRRQITLAGAHSLNHNLPEALSAIRSFGEDIKQVISHQVPLVEIPVFLGKNKPEKSLKVQAIW